MALTPSRKLVLQMVLQFLGSLLIFGGLIYLAAGGWGWIEGWAFLGIWLAGTMASISFIHRRHPDLIAARRRRHENTKPFDRLILRLYSPLPLIMMVLAGLDFRFGWTDVAALWSLLGLFLILAGMILGTWALAVNRHFETTVRIQEDRDHRVIDSGPYRYIRHPGYAGTVLGLSGAPLFLDSWWAYIPVIVCLSLFLIRTILEDRTLQNELSGYREYARRVRHRLLPGIW